MASVNEFILITFAELHSFDLMSRHPVINPVKIQARLADDHEKRQVVVSIASFTVSFNQKKNVMTRPFLLKNNTRSSLQSIWPEAFLYFH